MIYAEVSESEHRIISAWNADMKEKPTGTTSPEVASNWKRLRALTDRQIRRAVQADPEAKPTDSDFWKTAQLVMPRAKQTITIRLDADLLDSLRRQKGYQARINAVLRSYMQGHRSTRRS